MSLENLKKKIDEYSMREGFSGVICVTKKGKRIFDYSIGFADFENKIPFDNQSMFTYYSISKPFCAIAIMLLFERGLIDIDAHPKAYVPEANVFDSRLTIRHLMNHSSGIADFQQSNAFWDKKEFSYSSINLRRQLPELGKLPAYFAPNTGGHYTNINFILCALIIEAVTGKRYADFMSEEIFAPLGMKTACVDERNKEIPHRVKGYELKNGNVVQVEKAYEWMFGAGDIVGTVDDLYCLNVAIKNKLLLTEKSWNEILTVSPVSGMGLGCTVYEWHGKTLIRHNGGSSGFRTLHMQLPDDDFDIILLSNMGCGDARTHLPEFIYEEFYDKSDSPKNNVEMDKGYI